MMPKRDRFPRLNNLHDLKHIVHDLKRFRIKDNQLIELAKKLDRIILTKNVKHFMDLCSDKKVDLIGVEELVGFEEIDNKVVAYLNKRKNRKMMGIYKNITQSSRKR
jgi:hypothetical protein